MATEVTVPKYFASNVFHHYLHTNNYESESTTLSFFVCFETMSNISTFKRFIGVNFHRNIRKEISISHQVILVMTNNFSGKISWFFSCLFITCKRFRNSHWKFWKLLFWGFHSRSYWSKRWTAMNIFLCTSVSTTHYIRLSFCRLQSFPCF